MISKGYVRNQYDNYVYSKNHSDNELKLLIKSEFEMKDLGAAKRILGMEIWRNKNEGLLYVFQQKHIEKVLESFYVYYLTPVCVTLTGQFTFDWSTIPTIDKEKS